MQNWFPCFYTPRIVYANLNHSHFGCLRRPMLALQVMKLFGTDIFLYVNLYRVKMFGTDIFLYLNLYRAKVFGTDIFLYVNLYRVKAFGTDICLGQTSIFEKKKLAKLFYFCINLSANNFIWAPMTQGFQIYNLFWNRTMGSGWKKLNKHTYKQNYVDLCIRSLILETPNFRSS